MKEFPEIFMFDFSKSIDDGVMWISVKCEAFFQSLKSIILGGVNAIEWVLFLFPWWAWICIVAGLGWYIASKNNSSDAKGKLMAVGTGVTYGIMLFIIGGFGYWNDMIYTLALIFTSVIISLIIGIPVGILVSASTRAEKIVQPILDAMQTMPSFVYLIPAVMFFGLGKVPAVIATTIYALPPVVRLTCLGIRQVDKEMMEAAKSFGCTKSQTLFKVALPQAATTIMTGVNQTTMMAVSMVVTCSMIGAKGLGIEVLNAINRLEMGRGLQAGISIVFIAVILDRLSQGFIRASKKKTRQGAV